MSQKILWILKLSLRHEGLERLTDSLAIREKELRVAA
jgi:hypothetical protein